MLGLAVSYFEARPIALLQATCERLRAELGEVASVAVLDSGAAVMIARAAPNQLLAAGLGVGHRLPAAHTSLARVLLSALDDRALEAALADMEIVAHTSRTTTDRRRIRAAALGRAGDRRDERPGQQRPRRRRRAARRAP